MNISYSKLLSTALIICFGALLNAQNESDAKLFNAYKAYTKLPREVAYAHLNKTTLIQGESLGFAVYILDKSSKKPSEITTNVYCTLENNSGKIIKKKLVLASDGVASGLFQIDSTLTSGEYQFKAYTNWMRNFDEHNFYVQNIKVINPEDYEAKSSASNKKIDAQFLPEGGHMILDVLNTIGVVIKDINGFGIPNVNGIITDNSGNALSNFKTNDFGIAKFGLIPQEGFQYKVQLNTENKDEFSIAPADKKGISMTLTDLDNRVALVFRTNSNTLSSIANKTYKLAFSNGQDLKVIDVSFENKTEVIRLINYDDLYPGMNIITLFDDKDRPLLERLFFKHEGIKTFQIGQEIVRKEDDSLTIKIPVIGAESSKLNNFSVSVLPATTKSYNGHHNIISYNYLQPYVKGYVENAKYYFTNIDRKKRAELDNLLLTQGWSSYDWNSIFNAEPKANYAFENGISLKANIKNKKTNQFIIYPLKNSSSLTVEIFDNENSFDVKGLRPYEDESIIIGALEKRNRVSRPGVYAQFSPTTIPNLGLSYNALGHNNYSTTLYSPDEPLLDNSWKDIEQLDEVFLTAKKDEERMEKIRDKLSGQVDFLTDVQRDAYTTFGNYIASRGFTVYENGVTLVIQNTRRTNLNQSNSSPIIYLDGQLLNDTGILVNLDMSIVDYVQVDRQGLGEGVRGAGGVIKIFTNPQLRTKRYTTTAEVGQPVKPPLAFATPKKFYAPVYTYYKSEFFQNYGVIDWHPNLKLNDKGQLVFKVKDTSNDEFRIFIEGVGNFGTFLVNDKLITIN